MASGTRRAQWLVAALVAGTALVVPSLAVGAPTVTMKASASAIPRNLLAARGASWPHTGKPGTGAELATSFTIAGTEDAGLPAPLRRVVVSLPRGTVIDRHGFATCHPRLSGWSKNGPPCPARSLAGAASEELDEASFGSEGIVQSARAHGAFFPASGGLGFWTHTTGNGPFISGGFNTGGLTSSSGTYKLTENLPLQTAVGRDLATASLTLALGATYSQGHSLISLVTLPKSCPAGGYPLKAVLSFGAGVEAQWESVATAAKEPC
jgi:hypothetical protein